MTEEEKKLYAKWERQKIKDKQRAQSKKRRKKGKNGRSPEENQKLKFIAVAGTVAVIMLLFVLYRSGVIFSNTREEVIKNYFSSLSNLDYDKHLKCLPSKLRREREKDRKASGLGKKEYMAELNSGFTELFGEGYTYELSIGNQTKLSEEDFTDSSADMSFSEYYEVVVSVRFRGTKTADLEDGVYTSVLYFYMGRKGGYWYVIGVDEDVGTLEAGTTADTAPQQ